MTYSRLPVLGSLRLLTLAAALAVGLAHADDYADVSQLVRTGKLADALTKADLYLAGKPRDPQMRFLKGVIQRDSGKTNDAIATFTHLTEDFPELPEPYNNLAVMYAGQSQYDKARTALEMAIRTNPSYATAHENLGDVYAKLASQAYNKALQLDATNPAVAPKLALIRELFSLTGAKGQRPTATSAVAPATPVPATPAATAPAAVVAKNPSMPTPAAPSAAPSDNASRDAEAAVNAWAKAWSSRDMKAYLASYSKDFATPSGMSRSAWEEERRQRIINKSKISVRLEHLTVTVSGNMAVAKFKQEYKANDLSVSSRKTLDLVKNGDRWQIVKESTGT
ncbi:tetratricopeptide repeat protein [Candidatus Aalborgicola defluviihabitans]|uniref:nuclear transport factor 2 family protein n=1 Tax=Candidatus Aalborgicola defluviihabitans TaxID=3386187 RepID=UPI001DC1CB89|nr:tetratricopeptide repeat protein [Burkholderiales bacterium]MBK6569044.1 tetratricopeptide repeat protein [Burkholderiales bacterium]MBK7282751.1 tetratricopeptide repeat protein [Burkholderiales bacterium]MBK7314722.1 tetratricopeptide repeat protein [Burkholderiales bacterium]MBL0245703.1 tetratricopeptide repeat protein [Rhodoferax sp.]